MEKGLDRDAQRLAVSSDTRQPTALNGSLASEMTDEISSLEKRENAQKREP